MTCNAISPGSRPPWVPVKGLKQNPPLHPAQVLNDPLGKRRAAGARFGPVAGKLTGNVVGNVQLSPRSPSSDFLTFGKGRFQSLVHQSSRLVPAQVLQKEHAGQQ